ncbi:hypothetical protein WICPIJ_009917 [Wickerhamomyces pijperi]|uniref:Uncharacterized protein n=1 Tax=Wickerhamomyces pijperi TaxID=599730 RepID=A0A9P8PJ86_WICPI|nr:hypothetical protein WICPIJ_009917 [Wickerhamomyces pijperi]
MLERDTVSGLGANPRVRQHPNNELRRQRIGQWDHEIHLIKHNFGEQPPFSVNTDEKQSTTDPDRVLGNIIGIGVKGRVVDCGLGDESLGFLFSELDTIKFSTHRDDRQDISLCGQWRTNLVENLDRIVQKIEIRSNTAQILRNEVHRAFVKDNHLQRVQSSGCVNDHLGSSFIKLRILLDFFPFNTIGKGVLSHPDKHVSVT